MLKVHARTLQRLVHRGEITAVHHPSLTEVVSEWSKESVPTEESWVFADPITEKPDFLTKIQRRHIRPAG